MQARERDPRDPISLAGDALGAGAEWRDQRPRGGHAGDVLGAAIASRRHGIVTHDELLAAGLTHDSIRHRLAAGRLHRLHRGVYAVGHTALTREARFLGAVSACGSGAALSHESAALHLGPIDRDAGAIHVTRPGTRRRAPTNVTLHRTTMALGTTEHRGILVTTATQTLLDLAATAPPRVTARAVNEARMLRLVDSDDLRTRAAGRSGATSLRAQLQSEPTLIRSEAERRLLDLVTRAGLPAPRSNVIVAGHEVDAHWPAQQVIVEVDGYAFHRTRGAFDRDRRRDQDLLAAGHRVLRTTWRQLTEEPEALVAQLAVALALA